MGQQQSKHELLYQQVKNNNIEGIKKLCREGARLEWIDHEGKTPLIVACLDPQLFNVAKTLVELGANVNAYRPGRRGGTPLHHAAKKGLENTVKLLLSHGANALMTNDDCETPLEVARAKGYVNVVRAIESRICVFSGWLRELHGPGFLEVVAPRLASRNKWAVVLPTGSRDHGTPCKFELAMYSSLQGAKPCTKIALWKANLEEPKFHHSNPTVMIVDNSTKTRIKLAPANKRDKQQLQWFCDACKGMPQVMHPPQFLSTSQNLAVQATAPPSDEDPEIAMAINASIQSAMAEQPIFDTYSSTGASSSTSWNCAVNAGGQGAMDVPAAPPLKTTSRGWAPYEGVSSGSSTQQTRIFNYSVADVQTATDAQDSVPSAPPIVDENLQEKTGGKKEDGGSSSCVICLDAPVEGACIPCGHMVGCMSCLKEIKAKKWGCPMCPATINQTVRLYAV
ncbi:PREDICTED: putative E3 ubiquitin-protein ligase XBAT34 [Populus euphratica]|uniref:E3 ubiquitin-protein ligase XBAT34 n=1 Tax=Populus euphratica TaxID=75702 RepID=A0AAJ6UJX2_POPEU|nr:PREDICTED: putative E3 ubiquitin-protein ligase XBAT34 [Populus euphratica]